MIYEQSNTKQGSEERLRGESGEQADQAGQDDRGSKQVPKRDTARTDGEGKRGLREQATREPVKRKF